MTSPNISNSYRFGSNYCLNKYKALATDEPLLSVIQHHEILLIASDGRKSRETVGGGWIIADVVERELLYGLTPTLGI